MALPLSLAVMTEDRDHERRWWTLGVLCLALTIIGIDNTILNVALPSIVESLGAEGNQLQWIVDAYVIVFAGLLLTAGALGDKLGRKRVLLAGLVLFGVFSALAASAGSATELIVYRGLMGIGGAAIYPSTLSILTNTFTGTERAKAIGIWAGVSGLGIVVGPLTGGLLLEHFSWGSVFLVNVPVCIAAVLLTVVVVPESRDRRSTKLDPVGALLSIGALVGLLTAIIEVPEKGWTSSTVLLGLTVGGAFLAAFAKWELTTANPMLDVQFFKNPRFTAASATITMTFFALFGSTFLLTQYFQFVLGYSPLKSGLMTAPVAIGIMIAGPNAPRLVQRLGTKVTVIIGLGTIATALTMYASTTLMSSVWWGGAVRILFGLGMGACMAPATESIMGALPRDKAGVGSAVNDTTRQAGGALGVAVIGSIFAARYHSLITPPSGLSDTADAAVRDSIGKAARVAADPSIPASVSKAVHDAAASAYVGGMQVAVLVGALVTVAAAFVAYRWLPARPVVAPQDEAPSAGQLAAERRARGELATVG